MIASFGDSDTELFASGLTPRRFQQIAHAADLRLRQLNIATSLNDLMIPKGNRLEKLRGTLQGYYSIRINRQWRIIFRWHQRQPHNVSIVDYH